MGEREDEIIRAGIMKKRSSNNSSRWSDRYFVLKGSILYYYTKRTDNVRYIPIFISKLYLYVFILGSKRKDLFKWNV